MATEQSILTLLGGPSLLLLKTFTQMPESDFPRSNSPVLPARNPDFQLDEEGRMVEVVPCTICGRKFAVDRIQVNF